MSSCRVVAVTIGLLASAHGSGCGEQAPAAATGLVVVNGSYDAGIVELGRPITARFQLINRGLASIPISSTRRSCGISRVESSSASIEAGGQGWVDVVMDDTHFAIGESAFTVDVLSTASGELPIATLTMSAFIGPRLQLEAERSVVDFGAVEAGDIVTRPCRLTMTVARSGDFPIVHRWTLASDAPGLSLRNVDPASAPDDSAGRREYEAYIVLDAGRLEGPLHHGFWITAETEAEPVRCVIRTRATVQRDAYAPRTVFIGLGDVGDEFRLDVPWLLSGDAPVGALYSTTRGSALSDLVTVVEGTGSELSAQIRGSFGPSVGFFSQEVVVELSPDRRMRVRATGCVRDCRRGAGPELERASR